MKLESKFQKELIDEIKDTFPGCVVMKTDPTYIQGFPDLLVLFGDRWAALEVKRDARSHHQPNQDYYVDILSRESFAAFIFPENREEVLRSMERYFRE